MAVRKTRPVARALYQTRGQGEHELSFWPGEALALLRRVDDNWLEGQTLDGQVGIFPANRVRVEVGVPSSEEERDLARSGRPFAVALHAFAGDQPGDLSLDKGRMVELLEGVGAGWTRGKLADGRTGIFPDSFVQVFKPLPLATTSSTDANRLSEGRRSPARQSLSAEPKPRPRPRIRRLTEPALSGRVVADEPPILPSSRDRAPARQPQSCPAPSSRHHDNVQSDPSVKAASGHQTTPNRRRVSLASLDRQLSSLRSSLQVERKMLRSARDLLKLTSDPEKQEKLTQAVAKYVKNIEKMEKEIVEIEAQYHLLTKRPPPPFPPVPCPPRVDAKRQQIAQRKKVLAEMIETELSFCHEMEAFCENILPSFKQWSEIRWEDVFGNIEEVAEVSGRLSVSLQKVREEENWTEEANVGTVFQSFSTQLLQVYGPYCRNHDRALHTVEKFTEDASKSEKMKEISQLGRLELQSVLIKPIQRVLQYPLLLEELVKATPIDHPHHKYLVAALAGLNQVAQDINEFKRRKDIVDRYTGASRPERSDRSIAYSMRKKARRMQQSITQIAGLRSGTVDPVFDEEEQRLVALESCLRSLQRNTTTWKEETERVLASRRSLVEAMSLYSSESAQVLQEQACLESMATAWKKQWQLMKEQLMDPLQQLLGLFRNPLLLVTKRRDKLLDYDSLRHDMDRTAEQERLHQLMEQCTMAKRMYEALNAQLLEELPQFTARVGSVASRLLHTFLSLQTAWHHQALDILASGTMPDVGVSFVRDHAQALASVCQTLSALHVVPVSLSASFGRHRPAGESATPPVTSRRDQLRLSSATDLRRLSAANRASRSLDDLNKIDTSSELDGLHSPHSRTEAENVRSDNTPPKSEETVEAVYEFIAENPWELSVTGGEKVTLLRPQDSSGSKDWWLVRDKSGRQGYVDAAYLGQLPDEDDEDYAIPYYLDESDSDR